MYWGGAALLIYMPFHIFLSQWLSTFTGGLDAWKIGKDILTALVAILCIVTVLITKKYTKLFLWLLGLTSAYLALHLILILATNQPADTGLLATVYNVRLMGYLLIGYSLALLVPKLIKRTPIIRIVIAVSTVVCLIGLLQWVLPKDIMTHFGYSIERGVKPAFFIDDKPDLPRVMSTIRDPNSLGAFLILPITLLAYGLVKYWNTSKRMLISGLLILHGLVLFMTFSRSAWLGALISVSLLLGWQYRTNFYQITKRYKYILLIAHCSLLLATWALRDQYVVQNVIFHADENTQLADSNELHVSQVQKGLGGIADQPLGHGPSTAGLVSIQNEKGGLLTENYFVQVGYETGILGLILLIALMVLVIKNLWQQKTQTLPLALVASFAGITLINMLLHTWANEAVAAQWWLLAGLFLPKR